MPETTAIFPNTEEMRIILEAINKGNDRLRHSIDETKAEIAGLSSQVQGLSIEVTKQQEQMKSQQRDLDSHKESVDKVETNIMKLVEMHGKSIDDVKKTIDKVDNRVIKIEASNEALSKEKDARNKWYGLFWAAVSAAVTLILGVIGLFGYSIMVTPK